MITFSTRMSRVRNEGGSNDRICNRSLSSECLEAKGASPYQCRCGKGTSCPPVFCISIWTNMDILFEEQTTTAVLCVVYQGLLVQRQKSSLHCTQCPTRTYSSMRVTNSNTVQSVQRGHPFRQGVNTRLPLWLERLEIHIIILRNCFDMAGIWYLICPHIYFYFYLKSSDGQAVLI